MKFSVLMSVYYKENPLYLRDAIASILNQTILPTEVVLIKDGNLTRELEEVIQGFIDKHPNLFNIISLSNNVGLGLALQKGIIYCSYDLVARMDTDDIARPDRFERQLREFDEDPKLAMVGSCIDEFEGDISNIISKRKVPLTQTDIYQTAKRKNPFNHMTVMYKKQAVISAGNYQPFLLFEDYYLWVRMILNGEHMKNIDTTLVLVRSGTEMYQRRGGLQYIASEVKLQVEFYHMKFIGLFECTTNIVLRSIVRLVPNFLRGYIYMKFLRD